MRLSLSLTPEICCRISMSYGAVVFPFSFIQTISTKPGEWPRACSWRNSNTHCSPQRPMSSLFGLSNSGIRSKILWLSLNCRSSNSTSEGPPSNQRLERLGDVCLATSPGMVTKVISPGRGTWDGGGSTIFLLCWRFSISLGHKSLAVSRELICWLFTKASSTITSGGCCASFSVRCCLGTTAPG